MIIQVLDELEFPIVWDDSVYFKFRIKLNNKTTPHLITKFVY